MDFSASLGDMSRSTWKGGSGSNSQEMKNPACEIVKGWRSAIPTSLPADDASLSSARLGLNEVFGKYPDQGCTPALDRFGPFGHSIASRRPDSPNWAEVRWGALQSRCATATFGDKNSALTSTHRKLKRASTQTEHEVKQSSNDALSTGQTAVVLRTWDKYDYYDNQLAWMRTMITELALDTGGRFQVFLLVNVKDNSLNLFDEVVYLRALEDSVPQELRDTALLWNEATVREWFPEVKEYGAQDQMYQALQIFSQTFPQFDYLWQMEMDARFTGNVVSMLTNAASWAKMRKRENLWERNARWYLPGRWTDYSSFQAQIDLEFAGGSGIWGPHPHAEFFIEPRGPAPPAKRDSTWGVGEEAELINFSPLIDPVNTKWTYEHAVHNFTSPLDLPRRMSIVSMTRTSRRLLRLISAEQQASGSWVVSESTPETWSLLHGLKAVYVPHLLAFNSTSFQGSAEETTQELEQVLHKGPAWSLAGGDHASFLWTRDVGLPEQRWLGASYFYRANDVPYTWWEYTNGTCTYPLLLHPIKDD
jgi:hypothetical protein